MISSNHSSDNLELSENKLNSFSFNFHSFKRLMSNIFPTIHSPRFELDEVDAVAILFLTALGIITRIFRIQYPQSPVFDEGYFLNFTNNYFRKQYFYDPNPPLGKLILSGAAHLAGYKGEFNSNSVNYTSMIYVALRITPAFFGGLCVPLSYLAMRSIQASHFTSMATSILFMSDLLFIAEARHFLSDGFLHFFTCLSIFSIFLYEQYQSIFMFIFEGICLGCVAATKYTSGGVILVAIFRQFCFLKDNKFVYCFIRSILLISIIVIVHLMCFTTHLTILPFLPDDSKQDQQAMLAPPAVQEGLIDRLNADWDKRALAPSMIIRVSSLVKSMIKSSLKHNVERAFSSHWYSWPLFSCSWVPFYEKDDKHICCLGNVFVWYPVFFGIFWNMFVTLIRCNFRSISCSFLIGYLLSLIPFMFVNRTLHIYHYAIPLIFGIFNLMEMIENEIKGVHRGFILSLLVTAAVFGYITWNPLVYGLTIPDFEFLIWNNKWIGSP